MALIFSFRVLRWSCDKYMPCLSLVFASVEFYVISYFIRSVISNFLKILHSTRLRAETALDKLQEFKQYSSILPITAPRGRVTVSRGAHLSRVLLRCRFDGGRVLPLTLVLVLEHPLSVPKLSYPRVSTCSRAEGSRRVITGPNWARGTPCR